MSKGIRDQRRKTTNVSTSNELKKVKLYMKGDHFIESGDDDFGCVYGYMPSEEHEEYSQTDARVSLNVNNILSRFPNSVDVPINSVNGTDVEFTSNSSAIEERTTGGHRSTVDKNKC